MLIIFPIAAFVLFFLLFRSAHYDWRESIIASAVAWGTSLTLITELLSPMKMITPSAVALSWAAMCASAAAALFAFRRRFALSFLDRKTVALHVADLDRDIKILLLFAGLIGAIVLVLAVLAPPSSWDAMQTYLPRAMIWISNRSVGFYPTPDYLQLVFAPWPSFSMMQSILLFGTDRLVNIFQALSFLACPIGISIVARQMGAGTRGQVLAAIVGLTTTQGILEASGVLNSYIVSFWMVATVVFFLLWRDNPTISNAVLSGLAGGLALLSKGHAYIYLPPIVLAIFWLSSSSVRILFLKRSIIFVAAALLVNAPTYLRNYDLTGSPLGLPLPEPFRQSMVMTDFRPSVIAANVVRHASAHFGTPFKSINDVIEVAVSHSLAIIGVDPDYSIYEGDHFSIAPLSLYEVRAGNPLHFVLALLSFIFLIFSRGQKSFHDARVYSVGIVVAFVFMSATIIWQTTTGRYHLPLFILVAPIVGLCLEKFLGRKVGAAIGGILIAVGLIYSLANRTRSFLPFNHVPNIYQDRDQLYFADLHESDYPIHRAVADAVNRSGCTTVGLDSVLPKGVFRDSKGSLYVYPVMDMINPNGLSKEIRYTGVLNLTSKYASYRSDPCTVICFNCAALTEKWLQYRSIGGRASVFNNIVVFGEDGERTNLGEKITEDPRGASE